MKIMAGETRKMGFKKEKRKLLDSVFLALGFLFFLSVLFPFPLLSAGAAVNQILADKGLIDVRFWSRDVFLPFLVAFTVLNLLWTRLSGREIMDHFFIAIIALFASIPLVVVAVSIAKEYVNFDPSAMFLSLMAPYLSVFFIMASLYRIYALGPMNALAMATAEARKELEANDDYQTALDVIRHIERWYGRDISTTNSFLMAPIFVFAGIRRFFSKRKSK